MASHINIELACALSENQALFWKSVEVDKELFVEDLIQSRIQDTSYYDTKDVHAVLERTSSVLDKDSRLMFCGLKDGDRIKILTLTEKEVGDLNRKAWRPKHPQCKFFK